MNKKKRTNCLIDEDITDHTIGLDEGTTRKNLKNNYQ